MTIHSIIIRFFTFYLFVLLFTNAKSQQPVQFQVNNRTLVSTDSVQPFWFTANQHGKIPQNGSFLNVTGLYAGQQHRSEAYSAFSGTWGVDGVAVIGSENSLQLNRLFAGVAYKGWELKGGLYYDSIQYGGLSTSNGNLARSGNARPVPSLKFSTLGFIKLPIFRKWLRLKAEYEEGLLNDQRFVENTHLHHKSLYGKFRIFEKFYLTTGLEHFVMWGGTSPVYGELPGWDNYFRYVFALPGNSDFPETDQKNISGNQLGTYQLELEKHFSDFTARIYVSHPFEDNSGINLHNLPDNLIGLHIQRSIEFPVISDFLYEFTNTRQQSIRTSADRENDSYYNHGVYRSGFTFHQQVMSSPLFFPVQVKNGISEGILSNRFFAHHVGMKGFATDFISWKGMLTYVEHWGTYGKPYTQYQKNLLGLLQVDFIKPGFPLELGLSVAGDVVNTTGKNLGIQLSVSKSW